MQIDFIFFLCYIYLIELTASALLESTMWGLPASLIGMGYKLAFEMDALVFILSAK